MLTRKQAEEAAARLSKESKSTYYAIESLAGYRVSDIKPQHPYGLIFTYEKGERRSPVKKEKSK